MAMKRRAFIQLAGLAGLAIASPVTFHSARAAEPFGGPYWILVTASGGWDPNFLFNPTLNKEHNKVYTEIKTIGSIPYAPLPIDLAALDLDPLGGFEPYLMSNEAFLTKFGSRLCVLNGVDTSTNNHDSGVRTMMCGRIPEGYPAIGALIAAAKAPEKPMAFISNGSYDNPMGLVPLTRVTSPNILRKVAFPNAMDPNNLEGDQYHTTETMNRIAALQAERLQALNDKMHLPRVKQSMSSLYLARQAENELAQLQVPDALVDLPSGINDLESMMQQTQLVLAAFKSGLAVAANLRLGGFDTHGDHDRDQRRQLAKLLGGLNYMFDQISAQGLDGKVFVVVASDFGRGPHYNSTSTTAGKDHWPITSLLAAGPGIVGNRLIGGTYEADQKPKNIDPGSLAAVEGDAGIKLDPTQIHLALRKLAGVDGHEVATKFPLLGEPLPLFG
jgi:uncharacterized protein (DUF1501 family)